MARKKKRKRTTTRKKKKTRKKTRRKTNRKHWLSGVIKRASHVVGSSDTLRDMGRQAKAPGKRRSRSGETYYEYRANRADLGPRGL